MAIILENFNEIFNKTFDFYRKLYVLPKNSSSFSFFYRTGKLLLINLYIIGIL